MKIVTIVGPTAVGKSALALELAQALDADIVTADSRQVYRYMDIGTAKPTSSERSIVAHYMLDVATPDQRYSAYRFAREAERVMKRISARNRLALLVGGTGFYVRALLDGVRLPPVPPNPTLRARLQREAALEGPGALHARLTRLDPDSACRIHANNLARVIRALEIVERLGGPVPPQGEREQRPALHLGLTMDRAELKTRADARVRSQIRAGLVEETRLLLEMGYAPDAPGLQGFGYRQAVDYLNGKLTLMDAISDYQVATHQYIRRQMTWFRSDARVKWIDAQQDPVNRARDAVERWLTVS